MMKKLILYGDSILRGVTFSPQEGRHRLCRGYRLEKLAAMGFEIHNHSRMGATVVRGTDFFHGTIGECDADSIVLFEYGGNDCDHDWAQVSQTPQSTHEPHVPPAQFLRAYEDVLTQAKATGAQICICSLVPIRAEDYLDFISQGRSRENIVHWLGDASMLYRYQENYNRMVEHLAMRLHCRLIDLRGAFLLSHDYDNLISPDGIHPSEEGHDLIENTLCNALFSLSQNHSIA